MFSQYSIKNRAAIFTFTLMTAVLCTMSMGRAAESVAGTEPAPAAATNSVPLIVQNLIANYRRILSLEAYSKNGNLAPQVRKDVLHAGEYLFVDDQRIATGLVQRLTNHQLPNNLGDLNDFLSTLANPTIQDADLFAVRGIITELARKAQLTANQAQQVRTLLKRLAVAHNRYGQELTLALSQISLSQSKPERPAWVAYIADIEKQYPAPALLDELKSALPTQEQQTTTSDRTADLVTLARQNEWQGLQLEKGSVLLTFDDGPHPVYTREILAILERYRVKAIFFQLGQNLGTVTDGHAELTRNEEVEKEILGAGHAIGNHSFTHPFLPKLDQTDVDQEIDKTQALLNLIIPDDSRRTHMFRAPYGARNAMILGEIGERGLRSVLWNVDSLDWSDPIPESIVHRILTELEHAQRGIILMHDIHPKTVIALPMLLDELIKRGYHFVQWDGTSLVATVRDAAEATAPNPPTVIPGPGPK